MSTRIRVSFFLAWVLTAACTGVHKPSGTPMPAGGTTASPTARNETMTARVEVELDIFSGMPNPTWVLSDDEAERFLKQLEAAPRTSARELSGNLGYRGFIVQVTQGGSTQLIRVQNGIIHISEGATMAYARDENRDLERWLLEIGKPHLKNELYQIVERGFK
jgi:hypothetical protein